MVKHQKSNINQSENDNPIVSLNDTEPITTNHKEDEINEFDTNSSSIPMVLEDSSQITHNTDSHDSVVIIGDDDDNTNIQDLEKEEVPPRQNTDQIVPYNPEVVYSQKTKELFGFSVEPDFSTPEGEVNTPDGDDDIQSTIQILPDTSMIFVWIQYKTYEPVKHFFQRCVTIGQVKGRLRVRDERFKCSFALVKHDSTHLKGSKKRLQDYNIRDGSIIHAVPWDNHIGSAIKQNITLYVSRPNKVYRLDDYIFPKKVKINITDSIDVLRDKCMNEHNIDIKYSNIFELSYHMKEMNTGCVIDYNIHDYDSIMIHRNVFTITKLTPNWFGFDANMEIVTPGKIEDDFYTPGEDEKPVLLSDIKIYSKTGFFYIKGVNLFDTTETLIEKIAKMYPQGSLISLTKFGRFSILTSDKTLFEQGMRPNSNEVCMSLMELIGSDDKSNLLSKSSSGGRNVVITDSMIQSVNSTTNIPSHNTNKEQKLTDILIVSPTGSTFYVKNVNLFDRTEILIDKIANMYSQGSSISLFETWNHTLLIRDKTLFEQGIKCNSSITLCVSKQKRMGTMNLYCDGYKFVFDCNLDDTVETNIQKISSVMSSVEKDKKVFYYIVPLSGKLIQLDIKKTFYEQGVTESNFNVSIFFPDDIDKPLVSGASKIQPHKYTSELLENKVWFTINKPPQTYITITDMETLTKTVRTITDHKIYPIKHISLSNVYDRHILYYIVKLLIYDHPIETIELNNVLTNVINYFNDFSNYLIGSKTVEKLDLSNNNIIQCPFFTSRNFKLILRYNTSIKELKLNHIGLVPMYILRKIFRAISKNSTKKTVYMVDSDIDDIRCKQISYWLEHKSSSIIGLDLSNNKKITATGAAHLVMAIQKGSSIQWIKFINCGINEDTEERKKALRNIIKLKQEDNILLNIEF